MIYLVQLWSNDGQHSKAAKPKNKELNALMKKSIKCNVP